jgi:hypothetical protein
MLVRELIEALKKARPNAQVVTQEEFDDYPRSVQVVVESNNEDFVALRQGRGAQEYEVSWEEEKYLFDNSAKRSAASLVGDTTLKEERDANDEGHMGPDE